MVRVISIRHSTPARFKLTKLFGIYDFSVEKDSGKVLIIIIYCFYKLLLLLLLLLLLFFFFFYYQNFIEHFSYKIES